MKIRHHEISQQVKSQTWQKVYRGCVIATDLLPVSLRLR